MTDKLRRLWAAVLVVLAAAPTWGAAAVIVLTTVAVEVVPLLPGPWAVRVGAWLATAVAAIQSVIAVVSRVMRAPAGTEGLFVPEGKVIDVQVIPEGPVNGVPVLGHVSDPHAFDAAVRDSLRHRPPHA